MTKTKRKPDKYDRAIAYLRKHPELFGNAKRADRLVRKDGRNISRFVRLYSTKTGEECIGRCRQSTMDLFVSAGLWDHSSAMFTDFSDTAYEYWWPVDG